jgi:hypothetical protein
MEDASQESIAWFATSMRIPMHQSIRECYAVVRSTVESVLGVKLIWSSCVGGQPLEYVAGPTDHFSSAASAPKPYRVKNNHEVVM